MSGWLMLAASLLAWRCPAQTTDKQELYRQQTTRTVATLAGDSLAGRGYGPADGARHAAHYLAGRFRSLGLEPLGDSVGRSYYQHFRLPINTFPGRLTLVLDGRRTLRPGFEFIAAPDCPTTNVSGRVVALDTTWFGLDSGLLARRLRPRSLRDRVLVLLAQDEKRLRKLPLAARRWVASAAAVLVREPKKLTASLALQQAHQPWVRILDSAWSGGTHQRPARRVALTISARFEPSYPAMNVIGLLPARGPRTQGLSDSVLIVTAHYDHLGQQGPDVTFTGANDNASGTAMLLELARQLAFSPRRHDLIWIGFGAEEAGLIGSQWCAAHPPVPLSRIRFLLNLDLEGFGDQGATVVNATLHPRQFQLLDSLNRRSQLPMLPQLKQRGRAANSDHYPSSERGVPAFFVYSLGGPGYYHDVRDRPATVRMADSYSLYQLLRGFVGALDAQP